jgi:predicted GNAT family acetyltransferase
VKNIVLLGMIGDILGRGDAVAVADYKVLDSGILFSQTEAPPALGGCGIAKGLVRAGLKYARDNGLNVMPGRSFDRHREAAAAVVAFRS